MVCSLSNTFSLLLIPVCPLTLEKLTVFMQHQHLKSFHWWVIFFVILRLDVIFKCIMVTPKPFYNALLHFYVFIVYLLSSVKNSVRDIFLSKLPIRLIGIFCWCIFSKIYHSAPLFSATCSDLFACFIQIHGNNFWWIRTNWTCNLIVSPLIHIS